MPDHVAALVDGPPGLDDPAGLRGADVTGVLLHASMGGAQVRVAGTSDLSSLDGYRPRSVVWVTGRGDRARAAAGVVSALAERSTSGAVPPVVVTRSVPRWAGALDVILVSGDDPGDPVLVGAVAEGARRGAVVVLDVPAEGPVADASGGRALVVDASPHVPPHRGLLRHVGAGLAVLDALGAHDLDPREAADLVDEELAGLGPEIATPVNPAKLLAVAAGGSGPLEWLHDDPVASALSHVATTVFAGAGRFAAAVAVPDAVRSSVDVAATRPEADHDPLDDLFHDELLDGPRTAPTPVTHLGMVCAADPDPVMRAAAPLGHVDWVTAVRPGGGGPPDPFTRCGEVVAFVCRLELAAAYLLVGGL